MAKRASQLIPEVESNMVRCQEHSRDYAANAAGCRQLVNLVESLKLASTERAETVAELRMGSVNARSHAASTRDGRINTASDVCANLSHVEAFLETLSSSFFVEAVEKAIMPTAGKSANASFSSGLATLVERCL